MKIAVVGLWHLGLVTAAGLSSRDFTVIAYDPDHLTIDALKKNNLPIAEPGLSDLIHSSIKKNNLLLTNNPSDLNQADIIWITFDTPVDEDDHADSLSVIHAIENIVPHIKNNAVILISSQLPIGSTEKIKKYCHQNFLEKKIAVGYSPENLRLGKALEIFLNQDRIIVGGDDRVIEMVSPILKTLTNKIISMSIASAEMTKHALNAFLANSIVFINEIATLCEYTGADANAVSIGLKSESRIGPKTYLQPGSAIAGGTLMRDVTYLNEIALEKKLSLPLIKNIFISNQAHKSWAITQLKSHLKNLNNKKIVIFGLSYKNGTDTLRRSMSVELAKLLIAEGATIFACDPDLQTLPHELGNQIILEKNLSCALKNADALLIMKESHHLSTLSNHPLSFLIVDPNGYAQTIVEKNKNVQYYTMGKTCQ